MLKILQGFSSKKTTIEAIKENYEQIKQSNVKYVMFFASNQYDFDEIASVFKAYFPEHDVVGCTTAGEISNQCLTEHSLVSLSIASDDFHVASIMLENISEYPILYHDRINEALKLLKVDPKTVAKQKNLFGITLMDGLSAGEEKALSVINGVLGDNNLPLIGASAGDGLDFKETKIALNGVVYSNAALISFIKTGHPFFIYKENIFKPMGKQMVVTKADVAKRTVYEFDNKPAAKCYAEKLNIRADQLSQYFAKNPLGRRLDEKIWITSPFNINPDQSIEFYCRVLTNSVLEILEPNNPLEVIQETKRVIKENVRNIKGLLVFNCILRRLQFDKENIGKQIIGPLCELGPVTGFSSYGEQLDSTHLNQTMVVLTLGE
ncbi:FIST signal transduction protein [Fusibacter sp. 3D3]|uniref:FIST signal transduction protein n=1 Tax=Fusibacter sp. 3D3 TaxID=1048380 RepID=UPI000852C7BF|nr:FIST N-terminal domain-containing protein [Fusibacter sp. 3D3]GAU77652.1 hypothetical protein F3D3_2281 [Fusibacter sp. 3D3]